ncbi:hypothetical protein [Parasitella parasitica]|uniref:Uncharacterized protein n=1 Tax=Parasitella parasitica TaxID=35722 RepID=A0A0B7NJD5_9FUNG|nr:hypothetical protein [Parasitella parasitica]
MKLDLIKTFVIAILILSVSTAPASNKKRSTLGENTEVFTDPKAVKEPIEEEQDLDNDSGDFKLEFGDFDFDF